MVPQQKYGKSIGQSTRQFVVNKVRIPPCMTPLMVFTCGLPSTKTEVFLIVGLRLGDAALCMLVRGSIGASFRLSALCKR